MASRFEKLDKQLDRLGGLFSRRKRSTDFHELGVTINRPSTPTPLLPEFSVALGLDPTSQRFPEPPYIRPTSSRMVAREEVLLTPQSTRRARSLPESPSTPRSGTSEIRTNDGHTIASGGSDGCPPIPSRSSSLYSSLKAGVPQRSSSLYPRTSSDDPSPELLGFSFSTGSARSDDGSSSGRRSRPVSRSLARSNSISVSPKAQVDRKRFTRRAQHNLAVPGQEQAQQHGSPESYCLGTALPRDLGQHPSPIPYLPASSPEKPNARHEASQRTRSLSISMTAGIKRASEALYKSTSLPKLPIAKSAGSDSILKEPSLNDFLALSDDDIADGHGAARTQLQLPVSKPPTFALPPHPLQASTPRRPSGAPMLTLSPPLASRPPAAAAFEAARIAAKYQFDLVYVVNLWPSHMSRPSRSSPLSQFCGTPVATSPARITTPSPPATPVSQMSGYDSGFESRTPPPRDSPRSSITGRLLAAYGLHAIECPFRISAPVHQKVLRTEGWLEYRDGSGALNQLTRGYSCSFYTGYSPARGRNVDAVTTPDGKRRKLNNPPNRGIVFAALRKPRGDGTVVANSPEELEALHKDAEALVDMLIDMDKTERQVRIPVTGAPRRCVGGPRTRLPRLGAPLVAM